MILDTSSAVVINGDNKAELTKNELRILRTLMENAGRIISRDTLMQRLWETDCFVDENTLTVKCQYSENILPSAEGRSENLDMLVATYSGLLFLGIFLGLVFIFATVLIIYYKQVSEGYEDRERYATMRSVGMTEKEIKKSINSQVLTVFFAPLIFAGIHLTFAFPIILKAVKMLGFADSTLLLVANLVCFAVFALFYIFAYKITSGIYLKIIERK